MPDETANAARLTVATWNVHRCIGSRGVEDVERVVDVLRAIDADVVALQEIDSEVTADGRVDQLDVLARRTGLQPIAGPTLTRDYGRYGNAVLTRLPIVEARRHDLSVAGREPRGAIDARLRAGGGQLRVIATHLGLRAAERRRQVALLLEILGTGDEETVLAGDFNAWWPWGGPLRLLDAALGRVERPRTFPAHRPLFSLDRIWVRPWRRLVKVGAVREIGAARASDHLPVVAELSAGG